MCHTKKKDGGTAISCLNIPSSGPMCAIHFSLGLQRVTEFPRIEKNPSFTRLLTPVL